MASHNDLVIPFLREECESEECKEGAHHDEVILLNPKKEIFQNHVVQIGVRTDSS